jgi:hypothetical protein
MLNWAWRNNDRSLFGFLAGDETRFLDGREPDFMSSFNVWNYFLYESTDGTAAAHNWRWNRSVPGSVPGYGKWDYNDDGIQDTLILPDCGVQGCSALWSDTIAGGFSARTYGNLSNFLGVGPFSLRAGDTTSFIWFLGTAVDTTGMNRLIRNVTDAYLANFPAAQGYPAVTFGAGDVQVQSAWQRDTTPAGTEVRLRLRTAPQRNDPYLEKVVAMLESDDPTAVTLRRLNPTLLAAVRRRMQQNLSDVLVFKSCDRGVTWTGDAGCTVSPERFRLRDATGNPVGLGWVPRFTVRADSLTGALATPVVSEVVESGREYLYAAITRTRGLRDIPVTIELTVDASGAVVSERRGTLTDALGVDVDTVVPPLTPLGGNTVTVYAPITEPAGSLYASVDTATAQGRATRRLRTIAHSTAAAGTFRLRFGNRFVVTRTHDTTSGTRSTRVVRESIYPRAVVDPQGTLITNFVAAADTFFAAHDIPTTGLTLSTGPRTTVGNTRVLVDTFSVFGSVLAQTGGGSAPLSLHSGLNTPGVAYDGAAFQPGFTFRYGAEGAQLTLVDRGQGDTVRPSGLDANIPHPLSPQVLSGGGGYYRIVWRGDAFGPGAPFRWGHLDSIRAAIATSLAARPAAATATTDERVRQYPNFQAGTRPLIAVRIPFEVYGSDGTRARVAMFQRHLTGNFADSVLRNSRLLGTAGDTVRVWIPPAEWMPGDTLQLIETVVRDSMVGQGTQAAVVVRDTVVNGRTQTLPIQVIDTIVGMRLVVGCISNVTPARITCNPITHGDVGSSNYLPAADGWTSTTHVIRTFDQNSEVLLTAVPFRAAQRPLTGADANAVQVVPNPFVVQSSYDAIGADRNVTASRIMFVNVPLEGVLRVYSISGQLIRQLVWTAADLGTNAGVATGDLPFHLRTTSGREMAPGLYLYVLTGRSANARGFTARGKFVVIR